MRSTLRRCSSTLPRLLSRTSTTSRATHLSRHTTPTHAIPSIRLTRSLHHTTKRCQIAEAAAATGAAAPQSGNVTYTRFQELADNGVIHPTIINTLTKRMGLDTMTEVQSRTISTTVNGTDCIAQAKTGTGKTIAFLLPILQNIIKLDPNLAQPHYRGRSPRTTADDIRAIIISPTRELAEQIAVEAKRLVAGTSIVVQTAVGGTQKSAGLRAIQREGCHILVATPGRLNDILSDSWSRVEAPDLSVIVFDEADRLLEAGFWREIESIQGYLPDPQQVPRQTLMFSATVPNEVVNLVRNIMKPDFAFEQCVQHDEEPTHERVPQHIVATRGLENQLPTLLELCAREIEEGQQPGARPFKAIVYFSATNEVALASAALRALSKAETNGGETVSFSRLRRSNHPWPDTPVYEIHSRLSQLARTRAADGFRASKSGILLSSDVTARGLDFPDVTHVIQVGVPSNTEQYVHRIGRTARAGKEGEGWLIVDEALQLPTTRRFLGRLPIKRDDSLEIPKLDLTQPLQVSQSTGNILGMLQRAMAKVDPEQKQETFRSLLGAYRSTASNDQVLVSKLNNLAKYGWGMSSPPSISASIAGKLGLAGIRDLQINERARMPSLGSRRPSSLQSRGGFGDSFDGRDRASFDDRRGGFGTGRSNSFGGSHSRAPPSKYGSGRNESRSSNF